jgi:hypothetical protein
MSVIKRSRGHNGKIKLFIAVYYGYYGLLFTEIMVLLQGNVLLWEKK